MPNKRKKEGSRGLLDHASNKFYHLRKSLERFADWEQSRKVNRFVKIVIAKLNLSLRLNGNEKKKALKKFNTYLYTKFGVRYSPGIPMYYALPKGARIDLNKIKAEIYKMFPFIKPPTYPIHATILQRHKIWMEHRYGKRVKPKGKKKK